MTAAPILIMAGGTGGHVFPALAVAMALRESNRQVIWLGSIHGIENRLVPAAGFPLERIRVSGLRGKGMLTWILAPFRLAMALWDAFAVVRKLRPGVVLGLGGFASGPGGLSAWLLRHPLVIHEQNAVAGMTNRILAGFAREVLQAFPGSFAAGVPARTVGNPVRREILDLPAPEARLAGRSGPLRLLVLGGSQGALALNQRVPDAVAIVAEQFPVDVWHQAGAGTLAIATAAYAAHGTVARVDAFIDDMAAAYGWADLVVCRAGALTIAELAAAGVASILVPYPAAVDDHQTCNAAYLVSADAAVLLQQSSLTAEQLAQELMRFAQNRSLVLEQACRARQLAAPAATAEMVAACLAAESRA